MLVVNNNFNIYKKLEFFQFIEDAYIMLIRIFTDIPKYFEIVPDLLHIIIQQSKPIMHQLTTAELLLISDLFLCLITEAHNYKAELYSLMSDTSQLKINVNYLRISMNFEANKQALDAYIQSKALVDWKFYIESTLSIKQIIVYKNLFNTTDSYNTTKISSHLNFFINLIYYIVKPKDFVWSIADINKVIKEADAAFRHWNVLPLKYIIMNNLLEEYARRTFNIK